MLKAGLKEMINFSSEKNAIKFNALSVFVSDFIYSSCDFFNEIYRIYLKDL